jgi:DNA-binding Lrp family transcriptional regulator
MPQEADMAELDSFDMRILAAMQARGDISNVELAEAVLLSPTQCARRLQRLRAEGYIRSVVALLDPVRLGFGVTAHTLVQLRSHDEPTNTAFRRFVTETDEIVGCWSQTGDVDYLLRIVVRDLSHLADLIERLEAVTGGVASLRSSIVLREFKQSTALPLPR